MNSLMMTSGSMMMTSDPAAIAAAESAKARIQSAYMMALHKPRSYDDSRVRILAACKRPDFAEKVEFRRKIGKDTISGPSIRFAELALREWGNISYENQVVYDDENVRRIRIVVIDLETNATFGKEVQITKTVERRYANDRDVISERLNSAGEKVYLVKATEDEVLIREAAIVSKALRNEGLRLIPQEIVMEAVSTARKTMMEQDKKDPDAAKKRLIDSFAEIGIMPAALESFLGHPLAQCVPAEIQELRGMYAAIRDSEAKWSDFASKEEGNENGDDKTSRLMDTLKSKKKASAPVETPRQNPVTPENTEPVAAPIPEDTNVINPEMLDFPLPAPTAPAATEAPASRPASDIERLRQQLVEGLGIGRTEEEGAAWVEMHFKKAFKSLTKDDLKAAIAKLNAELDAKEGIGG